ncbi:MAG: BlaI/MecI/CopY family transcriptional regulator [Bacteroidales bacterium]|nr:BlaI/MecI/CopY family transcriptional regulator [Bacteroidales bacterium]
MQELTKAQEEILQVLWEIKEGVVTDVIEKLPEPKPAYNTVSTVIRVLEKKGYVTHKAYGKTHVYFPKVSKQEYRQHFLSGSLSGFFNNSVNQLVSFFVKQKKLSINELEELRKMIDQEIEKQKK